MEQLAITAIKCANKLMAKRCERITINEDKDWLVLDIHHENRIGSVSFRKKSLKLLDLLWHIHFYATAKNFYPFAYYCGADRKRELSHNNFMAY